MRQQAELHASRKEWPQAAACFETLLRRFPDDADLLLQLSYIESLAGHYRAARDYALRASRTGTRNPEVVRELIARLRTFNDAPALHACIDRLQPLRDVPIPLLLACAGQLSNLNEQERALGLLDEAARGDPQYPPTLLARAQVLGYLGRFDEAEKDLLRCRIRAPEIAKTYWLLARLRKQTLASNHIEQIRTQRRREGRTAEDHALLAYALHKELDDVGDYDAAWQALEQACVAKRSKLAYRSQETRDLVDRLMAFQASGQGMEASEPGQGGPAPIFIVGMHRSGTTLLEQMLDGHHDVRGLGELYDFTSQMRFATDHHCRGVIDNTIVEKARDIDFASVGAGYLSGVQWRLQGERFFTDKLPSNFFNLGFICRALPQARILHMVRDPVETAFSNLRELFSDANPYSYDQEELGDFYVQYQRLMAHWHRSFPGRILDVSYARLTRDPELTMRSIAGFCGFDYEPAMLQPAKRSRGVATASAVQVRGEITALETPKWGPYAEYLRPLRAILERVMHQSS